MKKTFKIKQLILSLGLFCVFTHSFATSSTTHFHFDNIRNPNDVSVEIYNYPPGISITFSTPPPNHIIPHGKTAEISITTLNIGNNSETGYITYKNLDRPQDGFCRITFVSARWWHPGFSHFPAHITKVESAPNTPLSCSITSGSSLVFKNLNH